MIHPIIQGCFSSSAAQMLQEDSPDYPQTKIFRGTKCAFCSVIWRCNILLFWLIIMFIIRISPAIRSFLGWNNYISANYSRAGMRKQKSWHSKVYQGNVRDILSPRIYTHHTETPMGPYSGLTYPPSPDVHKDIPTYTLPTSSPSTPCQHLSYHIFIPTYSSTDTVF